ncbi:Histone-lysine N-methyltransferase suvr3 [Trifolium repens]|nr:Histone-lysine N-methyltransferase suvr3 [Trifolium repens]
MKFENHLHALRLELETLEQRWIVAAITHQSELLTTKEARRRQEYYNELASRGRFSSALLVVKEHLPSGKACLRLNIVATRIGNVARFVNHLCDGGSLSTKLIRSSGGKGPMACHATAAALLALEHCPLKTLQS